jgi:leukotriene-A4 hydrolase
MTRTKNFKKKKNHADTESLLECYINHPGQKGYFYVMDPLYESRDFSSFSNLDYYQVNEIKFEWDINFQQMVITGLVEHDLLVKTEDVTEIILDSSNITVTNGIFINGIATNYQITPREHPSGSKMIIDLPEQFRMKDCRIKLLIIYATSPESSAIHWISASGTKGCHYPYVFTQSQAIYARSLFPCFDSPGVKAPYSAIVTAPASTTVLMSALPQQEETTTITPIQSPIEKPLPSSSEYRTFYWYQPVPISSYLIAFAAGHFVSRDISDRVRIWSEPEQIDASYYEFGETDELLHIAEEITGCPYPWSRYDILCLPPSFPYNSIENPCLTFVTPTLLAGDRSLIDSIAHEIAHSWTGNLVTNVVWNHFWLNEGWTVWLERKIISRHKHNYEIGKLSAQFGLQELKDSIDTFGLDCPWTQLVWPLQSGQDPNDAFSLIPNEKVIRLSKIIE